MTPIHRLIMRLEMLFEIVFPKKRHSAAIEQSGVLMIARQREMVQYKGHLALLPYNSASVKHFLYAIKYERHRASIVAAADILREHIYDEIQEMESVQNMQYALCTIPMTEERRMRNGYNHLHAILDVFYRCLSGGMPSIQDERGVLIWTRHVARQSRLQHRADRLINVSGAMTTAKQPLLHTTYFVIDDITTTGATLAEARRALIANGAHTVITLALAH